MSTNNPDGKAPMSTQNRKPTAKKTKENNTLLNRVQKHFERFIAFANKDHSFVLSLWILHTHAFDAAVTTPYMYVSSVDPGAGKSTVLETARDIARVPLKADNVSASVLFRMIDAENPTFILDEVDTIYSGSKNEELRSVLNGGYEYSGMTMKTIDGEPQQFSTFCPKMFGGIDNGQLPETVLDRCIRIRLRKINNDKLAELGIERRNIKRLMRDEALSELKQDITRWATIDEVNRIEQIEPQPIEGLSARQWDIAEPLMQIAIAFGVGDEARAAIANVFKGEEVETEEVRILKAARELFDGTDGDRITTAMLAGVLGYTPDRLSRTLAKLGVKARPMKVAGNTVRGYFRTEFESAWERFI